LGEPPSSAKKGIIAQSRSLSGKWKFNLFGATIRNALAEMISVLITRNLLRDQSSFVETDRLGAPRQEFLWERTRWQRGGTKLEFDPAEPQSGKRWPATVSGPSEPE
jgi:hypothetical protein